MMDLPQGFMLELVRDKRAMQGFSALTEGERACILARARAARTTADLRLGVLSLSDRREAHEPY